MSEEFVPPKRTWPEKFRHALWGMAAGIRGQSSFVVHLVAAAAVVVAAALVRVDTTQWCILIVCITMVLAAEMFNSALEHLGRAVDRTENPGLATALDIGSAAVLTTALGAGVVGSIVFLTRLAAILVSGHLDH
jgi:diacylglycerol kinase